MTTFPNTLPQVTDADRVRFQYYREDTIAAILLLESLSDYQLEGLIRQNKKITAQFVKLVGMNPNPSWIVGTAREILYFRSA